MTAPRTVAILGSTGSIGTQALSVVSDNPDRFRVVALAGGRNTALLARQAAQTGAELVAAADGDPAAIRSAVAQLSRSAGTADPSPEVMVGAQAASSVAASGADIVLNGITGSVGLRPTLAALGSGARLALANKESLIVGGGLVKKAAGSGQIVPVDSEHSAILQCLRAGRPEDVRRLVVTASGGPFRGRSREQLREVTPRQALAHPTWQMGRVITTNSATLVNKGLEVIEAHLLFDVPYAAITVVVHPQSVVHSMVEFRDGSTIAKASPPSMLIPIALALAWPDRLDRVDAPCAWTEAATWTFEPLDDEAFPAVSLARQVGEAGGTFPAVYNAANEVGVDAFHDGRIGFLDIVDTIERVVGDHGDDPGSSTVVTDVEQVLDADRWARRRARTVLGLDPAPTESAP